MDSTAELGARGGRSALCLIAFSGVLLVCAAAVAPGVSRGATVLIDSNGPYGSAVVRYQAATGERNRIDAMRVNDHTIRVGDTGAIIEAFGRCRSLDAHTARCRLRRGRTLNGIDVTAGDRNDVVRTHGGEFLTANGGPGDDTLALSPTATTSVSTLNGGGGRDTLVGGGQQVVLMDGDAPGAGDADVFDGTAGQFDTVSYSSRAEPVRIRPADAAHAVPVAGDAPLESSEGDILRGIESVVGGSGADDLVGGAGRNWFAGGDGPDRLVGRSGRDSLVGGLGADHLSGGLGRDYLEGGEEVDRMRGGAGNDQLLVGDGGPDYMSCGAGRHDLVLEPDQQDFLPMSCERAHYRYDGTDDEVDWDELVLASHLQWRGGRSATLRLECPQAFLDGRGDFVAPAGAVEVRRADGRAFLLGGGAIPKRPSDACGSKRRAVWIRVPVDLTRRGRRLGSRPGGVRVTVSLSGPNVPPTPWTVRLVRRR